MSATAYALSTIALGLLPIEFARIVCLRNGLGESHYDWTAEGMSVARSNLRLFELFGLPFAFLAILLERQANSHFRGSLGRVSLTICLVVLAFTLWQLFHPKRGIFTAANQQSPRSLLIGSRTIGFPLIALLPVALVVIALDGYQYTAFRIGTALFVSLVFFGLLWVLAATLFRWIRVKRRQLRRQQLMESRTRATPEEGAEMSDLDALAIKAEAVDLVAMDQQARRAIGVLLFVIGLFGFSAVWYEYLPALTPILGLELWSVTIAGGALKTITLGMLILAILVLILAVLASRNIPGLIDAMLLGRLGMDSPSRYAASTLTRYALVIAGLLTACDLIGITWSTAQWLVAALGVGLGFGLQEVVANFVCGILLLFERPIRVGDFVTLGETTGVVTRIRSRATTVRNWDRQEVIIPNKELITSRIVNWSLDDQVNRIVIKVGIAYGSDTDRAREVLFKILESNGNVLDDPRPLVVFDGFGDSALNFTIFAFLAKIDDRLETIHQMHTNIHQQFAPKELKSRFRSAICICVLSIRRGRTSCRIPIATSKQRQSAFGKSLRYLRSNLSASAGTM